MRCRADALTTTASAGCDGAQAMRWETAALVACIDDSRMRQLGAQRIHDDVQALHQTRHLLQRHQPVRLCCCGW